MSKDIMTPEERLQASVKLEPVDRVACAPLISEFAGQFAGITNKEFHCDWNKKMAAFDLLKETFPIWDCNRTVESAFEIRVMRSASIGKYRIPGFELDENAPKQSIEEEYVTRDELNIIKEQGVAAFMLLGVQRTYDQTVEQYLEGVKLKEELAISERDLTVQRGQSYLYGAMASNPLNVLVGFRTMQKFYKDMFQIPDFLDEVFPLINQYLIKRPIEKSKKFGIPRVFIGGSRGCGQFISKKNFERFSWPYIKETTLAFIKNGITPYFHFDSDWTTNLEYFLELPKGKCVLELDSTTDIFKAKEILKDHMCLLGDVGPILFTLASPSEMDEYCKKLIQVVGKDGGFILGSGCTVPFDAKPANVKAFFDSVEKYGRYN